MKHTSSDLPYVLTVVMSKSTPIRANPATKRSHDDHEEHDNTGALDLCSETPVNSPENDGSASMSVPFGKVIQPCKAVDRMVVEDELQESANKLTEKAKGKAPEIPLPDSTTTEPGSKRVRLQEEGVDVATQAPPEVSVYQDSGPKAPESNAFESNDIWAADTSSGLVEEPANLQHPNGTWPGRGSSNSSPPTYCPSRLAPSPPPSQRARAALAALGHEQSNASASADHMDVDG